MPDTTVLLGQSQLTHRGRGIKIPVFNKKYISIKFKIIQSTSIYTLACNFINKVINGIKPVLVYIFFTLVLTQELRFLS